MRILLTIVFFFSSLPVFAQADSIILKRTMLKLDKALVEKDNKTLQAILHRDLSFGHSNGWAQTKADVLNDFSSGKLAYKKIENNRINIISINKKWATVRTNTIAEGIVNNNGFNLYLHVLQIWIKTKNGWQLMARQSAKQ